MDGQILAFLFILVICLIPGFYQRYFNKNSEKSGKYFRTGFQVWIVFMIIVLLLLGYTILDKVKGIETNIIDINQIIQR